MDITRFYPPQAILLPFLRKEQLTKDTYRFFFDKSNSNFSFIAGQYVRVILPHENVDERGTSRFFSLTASPLDAKAFSITTRVIQSSFKYALQNLQAGQQVSFFGPLGRFVLPENENSQLVFLAGGIGITPFYSMICYAGEKKLSISIILVASFSTREEIIFYNKLNKLVTTTPKIKVIYTITHPSPQQSWTGQTGRISQELLEKYHAINPAIIYYIAGPPAMVSGMDTLLQSNNISKEHIKKETFTGY